MVTKISCHSSIVLAVCRLVFGIRFSGFGLWPLEASARLVKKGECRTHAKDQKPKAENQAQRRDYHHLDPICEHKHAMSSFAWIIILVLLLTLLGTAALVLVTVKYYWGERGTPPLTGEERRRQKEEELKLRAMQIELAEKNPVKTRKPSFWDNTKVR